MTDNILQSCLCVLNHKAKDCVELFSETSCDLILEVLEVKKQGENTVAEHVKVFSLSMLDDKVNSYCNQIEFQMFLHISVSSPCSILTV